MIERLTASQRDAMAEYADRGIRIGLCTDRIDKEAGERYAVKLMAFLGRPYRGTIYADGYLAANVLAKMLVVDQSVWKSVDQSVYKSVRKRVDHGVRKNVVQCVDQSVYQSVERNFYQSVWENVVQRVVQSVDKSAVQSIYKSADHSVRKNVRKSVRESVVRSVVQSVDQIVWKSVDKSIYQNVRESANKSVVQSVRKSVDKSVVQSVWPYLDGQFFSFYPATYDYYTEVLGLDLPDYSIISDQCAFGGVYPMDDTVIIVDRPETIRLRDGVLHCDGSHALSYRDGLRIYALHGVTVPEHIAVTPAGELDPAEFAKIENAEVRREFVRKVGIERIVSKIGCTTMDTHGDYELLAVPLGGSTGVWPYLKMRNPSIGVWHMEVVSQEIKTVQAALTWRNQTDETPSQLT